MKKIFSLIAAVLFAGSMMAESITISAENFKSSYNEGTFTISEVEYAYTGAMYNGKGTPTNAAAKQFIQLRKSGSGAGEIKNKGALNLKSIVVATQNNQAFTLSAGTAADALTEVTKPTGTAGKYTCEHKEGGTLEFDVTLYTFDVSGKKYFDFLNGDKAQYLAYITIELEGGDTPQEDVYTVAGDSETAFGTTWDPTNTANDMIKLEDGTYKWEKTGLTLAAGDVKFKVCQDHDWAVAYPAQDYVLNIPEAGIYTITITYNPEGNVVAADAVKTGEAVVIPTVAMHGNFTGEWKDTENFTLAEGNATASLKLTIAAGNYEFGMRIGGSGNWTANGAAFSRESNSAVIESGQGNLKLTADVAGEYTFTYTYETQTLAVTFPALPEAPISLTDFIANKPTEEVTLKDLTVIFASGSNTYVIDADGVALVIYDKNKTYYDGTLTAGKVLSGQKATYTVYNNQDEIIPTNAAAVSDGTAPEAEARTEAPTVDDVNKYLSFKKVEAKVKDGKYYIFDGAVLLYGATGSLKPTEDGKYDLEGLFINFKGNQLELIVTAIKKSSVDPIPGDEVELNITKGVMFTDAVEEEGWWQVRAMNDHYFITLSNAGEIAAVAGTYTAAQLDAEYSYINDLTEEIGEDGYTDITFTAGSVTVAVAQDGKVSFVGTLTGSDGKTYNINIVYTEPKAETTVNFTAEGALEDYIESMGGFMVGAQKDNVYVQVFINSDQIAGEYTVEDLDLQYSYIQLGEGEYAEIYSATIKVVANADGSYTITADVLCYGDVLYKITVTIPSEPTAIDNATIAGKIRKAIINGNVVIEKDNTLYNVNGAIVR